MQKNRIILFAILLVVLTSCVFYFSSNTANEYNKSGVFTYEDITTSMQLAGEWEFYPNILIIPSEEEEVFSRYKERKSYIAVPSDWKKTELGQPIQKGTYRAFVKVPHAGMYAIKKGETRYFHHLYLNGKLLPNQASNILKTGTKNYTRQGYSADEEVEVVFHVVSPYEETGGLIEAPQFAKSEVLYQKTQKSVLFELSVITFLFSIGIFYLRSFYTDKNIRYPLYFGVFAILQGIYQGLIGNRVIEEIIGELPFTLISTLQFTLICLITTTLYLFTVSLLPNFFSVKMRWIVGSILSIEFLFATTIAITEKLGINLPYVLYQTQLLVAYLFVYSSIIIGYIRAFRRKYPDSGYFIVLILVVFIYFLSLWVNVAYGWLTHWYSLFMLVLQTVLLGNIVSRRQRMREQELKELTNQLQIQDRMKTEFLQKTSHELQTPLYNAQMMTKQLLEGKYGPLAKDQQYYVVLIQNIQHRVSKLVQDLYEASHSSSQSFFVQPLAFSTQIIEELIGELAFLYRKTKKEVRFENQASHCTALIYMDKERFQQIMHNLLQNAIRFTERGVIRIEAEAIADSWVEIRVSDTGIGISQEHLPYIFSIFYQVNPETLDDDQHLGLGLSVVQQLVEQAGGTIRIESILGKGTTCYLRLPQACSQTLALQPVLSTPPSRSLSFPYKKEGPKAGVILLVDDEVEHLHTLVESLTGLGYTILAVQTGPEALTILETTIIDVLIVDLMMPKMSGDVLIKEVRKSYDQMQLPIILLTTTYLAPHEQIEQWEINEAIQKPIDTQLLQTRITLYLEMKRMAIEAAQKEMKYYITQISPHFLYNTMNTLISLSYEKPELVGEGIRHISTYFRAKLNYFTNQELVTLTEELELVEAYIAIEQLRFGDRLQVHFENFTDREADVPTMAIQTLVENSINHGILKRMKGGKLTIYVEEEHEYIVITIQDNGVGMSKEKLEEVTAKQARGLGIRNTINRIRLVEGASIAIESEEGVGTITVIKFLSKEPVNDFSYLFNRQTQH